ncbi:hypothetical protein O9X98_08985 [Agrobacterium salinitolerans]|nr:hypothetical protein [Agrobacterium salinitolerans]
MHIRSLKELAELAVDGVVILVQRDLKIEMASVSVGGRPFMEGNFWDFKPECHGGFHYRLAKLHGGWMSSRGLVAAIKSFLEAKGATRVIVQEEAYDWMAEQKAISSRQLSPVVG